MFETDGVVFLFFCLLTNNVLLEQQRHFETRFVFASFVLFYIRVYLSVVDSIASHFIFLFIRFLCDFVSFFEQFETNNTNQIETCFIF